MKKYPFITKPKAKPTTIGTQEIGQIVLPAYGGLLTGEQIDFDEVGGSLPDGFALASRLAVRMRIEKKLLEEDTLFCLQVVTNNNWEEEQREEIDRQKIEKIITTKEADRRLGELERKASLFNQLRTEYAADIVDWVKQVRGAVAVKQQTLVTSLLKYRGAVLLKEELAALNKQPEQSQDDRDRILELKEQIETLEAWALDDTKQLHSAFLDALWDFAQTEMNGGKKPGDDEELTAESVGKQPKDEPPLQSTGAKSSGDSKDTGLVTADLAIATS
ncbi:MAG TPA: hypothetical protein DCY88_07795 [Cyanobacteria bacterium UBA11372]|nr:hypothetical protein [Cyanobacteria bacterium UBA11372]